MFLLELQSVCLLFLSDPHNMLKVAVYHLIEVIWVKVEVNLYSVLFIEINYC